MTALVTWALLVLGLVYVTTCSAIFYPLRATLAERNAWLKIFMYCPFCQAFWFGLALTWFGLGPFHLAGNPIWSQVADCFAAIGVVVVVKAFGGLESPWAQEQGET